MSTTTRSSNRRLTLPAAFALIALSVFVHACGGGGGSSGGGGGSPAPAPVPGPTGFVSTGQVPADSATDVPRRPIILISFNDTVNPATVAGNVTLVQGAAPVAVTAVYNACNNRIQVTPDVALGAGLPYTVNLLPGLRDDDGESITAIPRTFTTNFSTDTIRPVVSAAAILTNPGDTADPGTAANQTTMMFLDWDDATDTGNPAATISYRIYASINGCFDFGSPTAIVGPGVSELAVPGLTPRTDYDFVVRAVDGGGNESTNETPVSARTFTSYLQNVYPIVSTNCVACHNPPSGSAWLNNPQITMDYSTPASTRTSWVGVAASWNPPNFPIRVVAGDSGASFLYNKINAAIPDAGVQMPQGGPFLQTEPRNIFRDWIDQGALDN